MLQLFSNKVPVFYKPNLLTLYQLQVNIKEIKLYLAHNEE